MPATDRSQHLPEITVKQKHGSDAELVARIMNGKSKECEVFGKAYFVPCNWEDLQKSAKDSEATTSAPTKWPPSVSGTGGLV